MRQQRLRYRYRESRMTLLREVCHRVGRQTPEEQVVVEAEVDRQDRQDHQEDHRRPRSRDYLQGSERKGRTAGMRELTRSYLSDRWRSRDT